VVQNQTTKNRLDCINWRNYVYENSNVHQHLQPSCRGVAHSVDGLASGLHTIGHQVLVVAPKFPDAKESTDEIVRMSALQDFTGSDFALPSPLSRSLTTRLDTFAPDIVHSHHPFLLGGTALSISANRNLPIIYTNHTRYDLYSHYIIQNSEIMKRLALSLTTGYCYLCDAEIAPSRSTADFLLKQMLSHRSQLFRLGLTRHL